MSPKNVAVLDATLLLSVVIVVMIASFQNGIVPVKWTVVAFGGMKSLTWEMAFAQVSAAVVR